LLICSSRTRPPPNNRTGTPASLFYLNELYDNLNIYVHGQSPLLAQEKPQPGFSQGPPVLYQPGGTREKKVIFISNYGDKARMCTTLTLRDGHHVRRHEPFLLPIHIQLNGLVLGR